MYNTAIKTAIKKGGLTMPRPKSGAPKKETLLLTLTKEEKENLRFLANLRQTSISAIIGEYAIKEGEKAKKAVKRKGKAVNPSSP